MPETKKERWEEDQVCRADDRVDFGHIEVSLGRLSRNSL